MVQKLRVTVKANPQDRTDDLRTASSIRRDLYAHSPVEIDPDSPAYATHRDIEGNAYFEVATRYPEEVARVLKDFGYSNRATSLPVSGPTGEPCLNCGTIAGDVQPTVCTVCGFRDIGPCPYCGSEVPRSQYQDAEGQLKRCPNCRNRVRLRLANPLFDDEGEYSQPAVVVDRALP
jgi:hypothetical protein